METREKSIANIHREINDGHVHFLSHDEMEAVYDFLETKVRSAFEITAKLMNTGPRGTIRFSIYLHVGRDELR